MIIKIKEINKVFSVVTLLVIIFLLAEFALALPKTSNESLPFSPEVLKQEAQNCMQKKDYSKAEQIYKTIMTKWPKSDLAFEAQKNLIILGITTGSEETPLAIGKFLANYNYYPPGVWLAFLDIKSHYVRQDGFNNMIMLYQNILSKHSLEPHAMWVQVGLATLFILQNEDVKAEAVIEKLLKDYTNHPDIAGGIHWIAGPYRRRKTDRAIELYHYILSKHPTSHWAMWAQSGLAICYILQNEDAKTEFVVEKLFQDYADHPDIAGGINGIANNYRRRKTDRAIELYQYMLSKHPTSYWAMWAQSGLAKCYILQNEDTKAEAAVEKLLQNYTDHLDIDKCINKTIVQFRLMDKIDLIKHHIIDNWINDGKSLQVQKTGLLFCIEHFDNKTASDALEKFMAGLAKYPDSANIINEIADYLYTSSKNETKLPLN